MTLVQKMFLFRRGQTLSCPLPRWRHSWYRPVVIVTFDPAHPTHSSLPSHGGHKHQPPPPPSLDDDTLKIQPFKHRYSNKLFNIQYVIQWGFDHFTECTSKNTWTALPIYRGHSNSHGVAQDTSGRGHLADGQTSGGEVEQWKRKSQNNPKIGFFEKVCRGGGAAADWWEGVRLLIHAWILLSDFWALFFSWLFLQSCSRRFILEPPSADVRQTDTGTATHR